MAMATGLTAAKMLAIFNASIVAARRVVNNVVLTTQGGVDIDLGSFIGPTGVAGMQMWLTTSQLAVAGSSQAGVVKTDVAGHSIGLGDLVLSSHASSKGLYGIVTAVASQASVTVLTVASLVGATGSPANLEGGSLSLATIGNAVSTWNRKTLDTASGDTTSGMFDAANGCLTIPTTGTYLVGGSVKTPSFVATHISQMSIQKSTTAYALGTEVAGAITPNILDAFELNCSNRVSLTAGDKIAFWFKFDATSSITLTYLKLWAQRIK